ncbi:Oligouridylate-binding protein 1 [Linum perenne]
MQQRLKQQHQALMHQALIQQQHMYHPGVLAAAMSQPIPSGNLPPGFDSSTCRSVYVGNIHVNVTEKLLAEVFQTAGPLTGCKLIRKEKSSYGFLDYHDRSSAAIAIMSLHGRQLYGQALKVNWAYANSQREDTSGHFHIFVGDLSPEVTDATLFACFSVYPSCSDARVMWDHKTGRSKGYGFVSFRNQQEAQSAINDLTEEDQENSNEEAPENNPAYTTVYVTQAELHCHFHALGVGVIEEVRIQRDKGFGFVRYNTHDEATSAIRMGNGKIVHGKPMKCSWGSKPTPAGTISNPLPPPAAQPYQIITSDHLLIYQRQLALSQAAAAAASGLSGQALVQFTGQHSLAASMGLGSAVSQALYDGYPNSSAAQQLMYYH